MKELILCIALTPILHTDGKHEPGTNTEQLELTQQEFEQLSALGAVRLAEGEGFTPVEPQEGIATVEAAPDATDDEAFGDPAEASEPAAPSATKKKAR